MDGTQPITVQSLKDFVANIPDDLNDKKLILDNFQPYADGYNPVTILEHQSVDVTEAFPEGESDPETEPAVVIRIM